MTERRWRWIAIGTAVVVAAAQWIRIAVNPVGDFRNHWVWGGRFVDGEFLYAGGANIPYLPFWAVPYAPLSFLPVAVAQALVYPLALLAAAIVVAILQTMVTDDLPLDQRRIFWLVVVAFGLSSRYLLRDLSEAGPNTLLMAITWGAIWAWWSGRAGLGGLLLGGAIALKLTAAIFLVYFALRREFRFVLAATVAAAAFTLAPVLWQGPELYGRHVAAWSTAMWSAATSSDPRVGVLGLETVGNLSLRPALARYLMHIPEGVNDQGRFVHPWNVDLLTLTPEVASPLVAVAILALVAGVAWSLRRGADRLRMVVAWDCAAIAILALLLSPITWRQHCVAILPACYLIARAWLAEASVPVIATVATGTLVGVSLLLGRGVMGDTISSLAHAYYLHTVALLLLLAGVIACRNRRLDASH
jgi:alpha-1,2-mannosyltransferase